MGFNRIQYSVTGLTDEQDRAAGLAITARALDENDARELLEACGLVPYESGEPPRVH